MLSNPMILLSVTLIVYYGIVYLQKKTKNALFNPVLLTTAFLIGYLLVFNISYEKYHTAGKYIDFWLKPSVVALGVPLYLELSKIKKLFIPLLLSQLVGSLLGIISVFIILRLLGTDIQIIYSLAPKSVTTPIAFEISKTIGGVPALTVSSVLITGILGNIFGFQILKSIKNPIAKSIALGTASHGLGIASAHEVSERYSTYASLGLIFNGIFTAILTAPILQILFKIM